MAAPCAGAWSSTGRNRAARFRAIPRDPGRAHDLDRPARVQADEEQNLRRDAESVDRRIGWQVTQAVQRQADHLLLLGGKLVERHEYDAGDGGGTLRTLVAAPGLHGHLALLTYFRSAREVSGRLYRSGPRSVLACRRHIAKSRMTKA